MIHSSRFSCVLDACVLYPVDVRDVLLWFAHFDLYTPKWSKHILDELKNVLIKKGMSDIQAMKQIQRINRAFPDSMVRNYEPFIENLKLPDKNDRHVLAVAIKARADLIVTNNLKDFDKDYLKQFDIEAKSADDFLTDIIDLNHEIAKQAFLTMVSNRANPAIDNYTMLNILRNRGLSKTAEYLHLLI
ncbi:MAG: PIN domain-containing protein [Cyclobacteriaceae bacterium]|nr:PIN domain-containing protein [Cyclobacteriaceae bacterium]MCX7637659.1 PIN domain-containing protein [Cyclobacteriaceae bacterium]MDW8332347.1 PIN domain-containing protein [Cyclobacteriaceae bacterium]